MPEGSSTSLAGGSGNIHGATVTVSDGQQVKKYAEIYGAEIMRVGTWNGNKFTSKDLEDIASAANEVGYIPPLKVGHDESIGARAWGWVRNLRVAGEKLLGDLLDIPESLAAIIRERGYDQLSAEIYLDLERDGKRFRRALKAVALMGAEVPAVSDLKPLRELFADASTQYRLYYSDSSPHWDQVLHGYPARTLCFTNQPDGGRTMPEKTQGEVRATDMSAVKYPPDPEFLALKAKAEAQATQLAEQKAAAEAQASELATLKAQSEAQAAELKTQKEQTSALEAKNREIALAAKLDAWKGPPALRAHMECLWRAASEFPRTVRFVADPAKPEDISFEAAVDHLAHKLSTDTAWMFKKMSVVPSPDQFEDPGAEVDARTRKLMADDPKMDYRTASKRVLDSDPALKTAYAGK